MRDHRTGNLKPNCSSAKGDLFEELTCRWRGVKNLNIDNDNYRSPIDHSRDSELGIIQTKGGTYNKIEKKWTFSELVLDHKKIFDNTICYCAGENMEYIERIYIFPREEIIKRTGIAIYKVRYSSRYPWYEEYRVKDEETIKKVNYIWKKILDGE